MLNSPTWELFTGDGVDPERADAEELAGLRDRLLVENAYLQTEIETEGGFDEMIGGSAALSTVRRLVAQVSPIDSTVLVLGETGTGKELVARAIHRLSGQQERPLIKVNCATIPPNLAESNSLATSVEPSRERCSDGSAASNWRTTARCFWTRSASSRWTSRSSFSVSCRSGGLERVGGNQTIRVDVRLVAATSRDLDAEDGRAARPRGRRSWRRRSPCRRCESDITR